MIRTTLPSIFRQISLSCRFGRVKAFSLNYFVRILSTTVTCDRKYFTKNHEWVAVTGDIGTIGISHYAQDSLGDIVYVQLPEVGSEVNASRMCGVVESVKSVSELYSPVSGVVTTINSKLTENPELINADSYGEGWLFRLRIKDPKELDQLLNEEQYMKFL